MAYITIYGTGSVGSVIAGTLAEGGHHLTCIARGAHLEAMKRQGLKLFTEKSEKTISATFTDSIHTTPTPDYLFLAVKAYSLPEIAESVGSLAGKHTLIIPVINGIPWWHFHKMGGIYDGTLLPRLDPTGSLAQHINLEQVVGAVAYMDATIIAPGVVKHRMSPKLILGKPDNSIPPFLQTLGDILEKSGFKNPVASNIRKQIWLKLCWNITFNPLSVIYNLPSQPIAENSETRAICLAMMEEVVLLTNALGIPLNLDKEKTLQIGIESGDHKPSMLQDFEGGKRIESDAIIGAALDIAHLLAIPTPAIAQTYNALQTRIFPHR